MSKSSATSVLCPCNATIFCSSLDSGITVGCGSSRPDAVTSTLACVVRWSGVAPRCGRVSGGVLGGLPPLGARPPCAPRATARASTAKVCSASTAALQFCCGAAAALSIARSSS
eukprot:5291240-Prymnesium_polylepis.5